MCSAIQVYLHRRIHRRQHRHLSLYFNSNSSDRRQVQGRPLTSYGFMTGSLKAWDRVPRVRLHFSSDYRQSGRQFKLLPSCLLCLLPEAVCWCLRVQPLQSLTNVMSKQIMPGGGPLHTVKTTVSAGEVAHSHHSRDMLVITARLYCACIQPDANCSIHWSLLLARPVAIHMTPRCTPPTPEKQTRLPHLSPLDECRP